MNHIQDTIPRMIDVQASSCSHHDIWVNSGVFDAIGGYGGRVLYEKTASRLDGGVYTVYMHWKESNNRWEFALIHYVVTPGLRAWGETIAELDFSHPG